MFGTLLQRSIFGELMRVFALSLTALTGLFVMAGLVAEASQRGLAPSQIVAVLPLLIPNTFPYTLPATTLFATCVVFGRLAADNEVTAVKAAGGRIGTLLMPSVILGLLASTATMSLYFDFIPRTHSMLRSQVFGDVEDLLYSLLKRNGCLRHPKEKFSLWVRDVQGRRLIDTVIKRRDEQGGYNLVARAREAEIRFDSTANLIRVEMPRCTIFGENNGGTGSIGPRTWDVPMPDNPFNADYPNRPSDLTWSQLFDRRAEIEVEIDGLRKLVDHPPEGDETSPEQRLEFMKFRKHLIQARERDVRCISAEVHLRPALSLGCFCFVLVGAPVGIWFSRGDYLSSFVTCFLPTMFVYYPLLLCGSNMAKDGTLDPALGMWGANIITATVAIGLRWTLLRR